VLQDLAGHDYIEVSVVKWEPLVKVSPPRLNTQLLSTHAQGPPINIQANHLVASSIIAGKRPITATDVQNASAGANPGAEAPPSLFASKDKAKAVTLQMMILIHSGQHILCHLARIV
jgi:hypothetical protein